MAIVVREADLDWEMPVLMEVFSANRRSDGSAARFQWLYRDNPDGQAIAWVVADDTTGEIAGCTAVFPRRVQVRGVPGTLTAWNCGDFSITPKYRTMGAAVKLRRAAKDGVDRGTRAFLYAHPNDKMLQVHLRVGHQPLGRMIRMARPLALSSGRPLLDRAASLALRVARPEWLRRRPAEIGLVTAPLGDEFGSLFEEVRGRLGTAVVRDARYLNWRFGACPVDQYEFLAARTRGRLAGYLVFSAREGVIQVKDWLARDRAAGVALFAGAAAEGFRRRALSVSVTLLETHPDVGLLRSLGFSLRPETSTCIAYAPASAAWREAVTSADAWYMTVGDRDL